MRRSILMIDDEEDFCSLVKRNLLKQHVKVDCAHSLAEGLARLQLLQPELLILDNNLPDGFGWTHAASLQKKYPNMKIVLVSANELPPYETTGIGMEFARVSKPIMIHELVGFLF